jgi:hypothetical protein
VALTSAQIVSLATQIARCPGYTSQAGQLLNSILSDLAQTYDFALARTSATIIFNSGGISGSGPYPLPADFLRALPDGVFFTLNGITYYLTSIDLDEYDALPQTTGFMSYPSAYTTNMELSPPTLLVWPPASGSYVTTVRYYRQTADIATPENSAVVPWFPNTEYLITRLAGELMKLTNDDRIDKFLVDTGRENDMSAPAVLRRYLKMKDDRESRAQTVKHDPRVFNRGTAGLKNTKKVFNL